VLQNAAIDVLSAAEDDERNMVNSPLVDYQVGGSFARIASATSNPDVSASLGDLLVYAAKRLHSARGIAPYAR
jgi:hypothetical protein